MNNILNANYSCINGMSNIYTDDVNTSSLETKTINGLPVDSFVGI